MKVIAFNGSPHKNGVIQGALELMRDEFAAVPGDEIEVEIIHVGAENIRGCIACGQCAKQPRKCAFDDIVNQAAEKVNAADGMIIGSPVYYGSIAGNFKCFLDRLFYSGLSLAFKPAFAVVSCRRSGGINAFHQLNNYFNLSRAIVVPSFYWGVVHGNDREELESDIEGNQIVKNAAQNMAWLLRAMEMAKKEIPMPEKFKRAFTNFVRDE
ncbi:MAG: flavodoxin family protein [Spirochaetes bacterium]|nr:flavodoxin family protein [Spirochaetota bacterium]